jgi:hypothetical protein
MLPRFQSAFFALVIALLIVVGTIGMYTAEASSFRSAITDAQAFDRGTPVETFYAGTGDTTMASMPGMPY